MYPPEGQPTKNRRIEQLNEEGIKCQRTTSSIPVSISCEPSTRCIYTKGIKSLIAVFLNKEHITAGVVKLGI